MEILRFAQDDMSAQDDMNAQDDSCHHGDGERVHHVGVHGFRAGLHARYDRGRADRWLELL